MEVLIELAIILVLVLANAVFALAEIAVVSARTARLSTAAEKGDRAAQAVLAVKAAPDRFLSTVQVGITLIGVLAGAFGGATLTEELAAGIGRVEALRPYAEAIALGAVVAGITFLSVVVGELVPKQLALTNAEAFAKALAGPMRSLARVSSPLISLLSWSSRLILSVFRVKATGESPITQDEIRVTLEQGVVAGVLDRAEHTLVERVMQFADRRVASLMTPRTQITWVDVNDPIGENMRAMCDAAHSHFPVCDGQIDEFLGVVSVKDLWRRLVRDKQVPDLKACLLTAPHVPEMMPALKLLGTFKQSGRHVALVLDEYGGISGLVTLHDVLEGVVGDLPAADEEGDQRVVRRPDGSWLLDGMLRLDELHDVLDLAALPDDAENFNTLAGLILARIGHLPKVGEVVEWSGFRFEVVDLDGHRIDRVLVMPPSKPQERDAPRTT